MTLDELITQTRTRAASIDPLDLLAAAARQQQELTDSGDELLDHWVQHARAAGCSWAQIGSSLGVTKQAAQQRHSPARSLLGRLKDKATGPFTRFTDHARSVVVHAQEEARLLRHDYIGAEHLLLGLFWEPEGIAAKVLTNRGMTQDAARAAVERIIGRGQDTPSGHIPFNSHAKQVLKLSLAESRELEHDIIGTEHVLLALLTEGENEGVGAQVLTEAGVTVGELRRDVLAHVAGVDS